MEDMVYEFTLLNDSYSPRFRLLELGTGVVYENCFPEWFYTHDTGYINKHICFKFAPNVTKPSGKYVIFKHIENKKPYIDYEASKEEKWHQWQLDHAGDY